ncbi:MAG TPA: EAL domain-containing protein [Afifellaceae bacterium]|nr:EAL domain-containing protein [Afifellaceae bacterium]
MRESEHHDTQAEAAARQPSDIRPDERFAMALHALLRACPARTVGMIPTWIFASLVVITQFLVVGLGLGLMLFFRRASVAAGKVKQLEKLLDVVDESIVVCRGLQITLANQSLSKLLMTEPDLIEGQLISELITDQDAVDRLMLGEPVVLETEICQPGSEPIIVEIAAREIEQYGAAHRLLEIRDIRDRKAAQERIHFLAHHDALTKLANREVLRRNLNIAMENAKAENGNCAVIWIDLDNFKDINDTLGHSAGDQLLCNVADMLVSEMPKDFTVTRFGGDEFVIVCDGIPDALEARLIGQQLRRLLNEPIEFYGRRLNVGASIGIAVFPDDATTADDLLINADLALYEAKANGRGRYQHFTRRLSDDQNRKRALADCLAKAIETSEIKPFFQPTVRALDGRLEGFEVLCRWHHPEFGNVSPEEFVKIAEEQGQVPFLTDVILRSAIETARAWPEDMRFAVNVSPPQINSALVDQVRQILRENEFDPKRLEIEVTEDALIRDFARTSSMFSRLRSLGIQIAMDDFGTGYTSINNLRKLNFDRIKIDKVLTTDIPDHRRANAIVRSMIVLARELEIFMTVEGIETEEQFEFFQGMDFIALQGFLFSPALPRSALQDLKMFHPRQLKPGPDTSNIIQLPRSGAV